MKKITVLLSTYNGEEYIEKLLFSVVNQKEVHVSLLIRDDGSSDNTVGIIQSFQKKYDIQLIQGNNKGYNESFWQLINMAGNSDYYALCDQDDYWCDDKLISAVRYLEKNPKKSPMLYTSNVISVDSNLNRLNIDSFSTHTVVSFADSLKKSVLPGCTFVFNNELLDYLKKYKGERIIHDWTIYLIAKAVGTVMYDDDPHILYRLHGDNACGSENGINGMKKMIKRFIDNKTPRARSRVARDLLVFRQNMSKEDVELTEHFYMYRRSIKSTLYLLKYKEYRDIRFLFMLILKRV